MKSKFENPAHPEREGAIGGRATSDTFGAIASRLLTSSSPEQCQGWFPRGAQLGDGRVEVGESIRMSRFCSALSRLHDFESWSGGRWKTSNSPSAAIGGRCHGDRRPGANRAGQGDGSLTTTRWCIESQAAKRRRNPENVTRNSEPTNHVISVGQSAQVLRPVVAVRAGTAHAREMARRLLCGS